MPVGCRRHPGAYQQQGSRQSDRPVTLRQELHIGTLARYASPGDGGETNSFDALAGWTSRGCAAPGRPMKGGPGFNVCRLSHRGDWTLLLLSRLARDHCIQLHPYAVPSSNSFFLSVLFLIIQSSSKCEYEPPLINQPNRIRVVQLRRKQQ